MDFFYWENIFIVSVSFVHQPLLSMARVRNVINSENLGSEALEWYSNSRFFPHSNLESQVVGKLRLGRFVSHFGLIILGMRGGLQL